MPEESEVVADKKENSVKVIESKSAINTPLIKKVSLTSTTKIVAPIIREQEEKKEQTEVSAPTSLEDQPVNLEALKEYWKEFAENRKEEGKSAEYQLLNQEIVFTEGHIIHIELTNAIQQNFLERIRTELLQFLRKKLHNNQLTIDAKLLKLEQKEMIYTATEKFKHLAKDYPHLNLLKDELGLDTDF